ncbi:hypothetical protein ACFV16_18690 [Streptomyces massasporeus]|uniref:hypothetical protein n=1 Tax=Streptomyces massasporeus TaxID=67324 RepID=UPI0036C2C6E4
MTTATEQGPLRRGAVRPGERALAPDLARGIMLLGIVLSNTRPVPGSRPVRGP